jgi:hypothetical protein
MYNALERKNREGRIIKKDLNENDDNIKKGGRPCPSN